jgi:hypothetical protein
MTSRISGWLSTARLVTFACLLGLCSPAHVAAQAPAQGKGDAAPATPADERPTVGGFVQFDYRRGDPGAQRTSPNHEVNVREARLGIRGKIGTRLRYTTVIQGDGLSANTASLIYAFAEYRAAKWIAARVGQYKYEFDMEGAELGHERPFSDAPFATIAVAGGLNGQSTASAASAAFADRGVSALATVPWPQGTLGLNAGVFQGAGRASDNNDKAAVVLNGVAATKSGFKLNCGFLTSDNAAQSARDRRDVYRAWTTGGAFDHGRWLVRGEYYRGRRILGEGRVKTKGYYTTVSFSVVKKLDVLARYQTIEQAGTTGAPSTARSVDVGARYYLDRRDRRSGTFVALSYAFRHAGHTTGNPLGLSVLNDGRGDVLKDARDTRGALVARFQVRF